MTLVIRGCAFPGDRFYHAGHNVWVKRGAGATVTLGATSFGAALAREFMGFVPKPAGTAVEAHRSVAVVELFKTMISVRSPVAGVIVEGNEAARRDPALISRDPYGAGWLVRLKDVVWLEEVLVGGEGIAAAFEAAMDLENFDGPEAA